MATSFCNTNSVVGENIVASTTFKKLGGLVFDAPTRNIKGISKVEFPVYTTDTALGGPHKSASGEIDVPISCGSYFIYPGDIIAGGMDGVMVVPSGNAEAVLEAAQKCYVVGMHSQEEATTGFWNREWIGRDLKAAGAEVIDGCCRR